MIMLKMEGIALILMGVFAADLALTVSALTSLTHNLQDIEKRIAVQMADLYQHLEDNLNGKKEVLTRSSMETMNSLVGLGQKHILHSVKEFHYGGL